MSVLVKNMKMPEDCYNCQFLVEASMAACVYCAVNDRKYPKKDSCPLIEIPPHGDLIDRWELTETAMIDPDEGKYVAVYRADEVDEASVVIEAEGRE